MGVPSTITDLSATAALNSPQGSDAIGNTLDDYLRSIQAILYGQFAGGSTLTATGSTLTVPATGSYYTVGVSGASLAVTGLTACFPGRIVALRFYDASGYTLTLTHNASALSMPGNTSLVLSSGDMVILVNESASNWRCVAVLPNNSAVGKVVADASGNVTIAGNASLGGTLGVTGTTTLTGALTANGAAAFNGTLTSSATQVINFGAGQVYKDASGNVGIGTATPGFKLDVAGTLNASGAVTFGSTVAVTGSATLSSSLSVAGTTTLTGGVTTVNFVTVGGALTASAGATFNSSATFNGSIASAAAQTVNFGSGQFYKDSAGNIGIGTTTPTSKLQVAGPVATQSPVTVTTSTYTVAATDSSLIFNYAGNVTLTLPTASGCPGRLLNLVTYKIGFDVDPAGGTPVYGIGAGGASALAHLIGATNGYFWATLQSDGTNWRMIARGAGN